MKDSQGRIIYYNRGYAEFCKVTREEALGKVDEELWPAELAATSRATDRVVLREWKTLVLEERIGVAGESPQYRRCYKFPFRDSEGHEYVAGVAIDVTADKELLLRVEGYQKALEEANKKLMKLSVTDGLTKLLNRRAFDAALELEFATSLVMGPRSPC